MLALTLAEVWIVAWRRRWEVVVSGVVGGGRWEWGWAEPGGKDVNTAS